MNSWLAYNEQLTSKQWSEIHEKLIDCWLKDSADDEASMERDRTLGKGSLVNFGLNESSSEEWPPNGPRRMCPMCEAAFPPTVTDEDFEMHVMEHFTFEEQETLKYIPPNEENGHDA